MFRRGPPDINRSFFHGPGGPPRMEMGPPIDVTYLGPHVMRLPQPDWPPIPSICHNVDNVVPIVSVAEECSASPVEVSTKHISTVNNKWLCQLT